MFRANSNLDSFLVNGVPSVYKAKDGAKNCDCKGDRFDNGHVFYGA